MKSARRSSFSVLMCFAFSGCASGPGVFPARPADAPTGSAFIAEIRLLPPEQREQRILQEILRGNVPEFMRRFAVVTIRTDSHLARYEVAPDYLAVGSDEDFVRVPMRPETAQRIADRFDCLLPTRKMVDDIYAQAAVKVVPVPFSPRAFEITSVDVFYQSNRQIERERSGRTLGGLVGGAKKDVVITPQLAGRPGKVAIYGWHRPDGRPIQPLYLGHASRWVDYSHGVRLVRSEMEVDGEPARVQQVLADPGLCGLLSDEGVVLTPRYLEEMPGSATTTPASRPESPPATAPM